MWAKNKALLLLAALVTAAGCDSPTRGSSSTSGSLHSLVESTDATATVAEGSLLRVSLDEPLTSDRSRAGDPFRATLAVDLMVRGRCVLPAGSRVRGRIREAAPAVPGGGDALVKLEFQEIEVPGRGVLPIEASLHGITGTPPAGMVDPVTATSDPRGGILGLGDGAEVVGGMVGAPPGTSVVMAAESRQVDLPRGTLLTIRLEEPLAVPEVP